ncbi:MAG TPA: guanylate kinase [Clostridia bacterium]|nr:guanylate kinase [Clostridia bacterium]
MQKTKKGLLIVLSGPSGVGKGVVCRALMERNPQLKLSVSATTRLKRPCEIDGLSYFFKSEEEFKRMIVNDEFLEYTSVYGSNYYGTPRAYVEEELAAGNDIILEIDVHGANQVKKACPFAIAIFLAPPSMSALKSRLIGRGTEDSDAVERRFGEALFELKQAEKYDYIVVNDVLDKAVTAVEHIISAEHMKAFRRLDFVEELEGGSKKQ